MSANSVIPNSKPKKNCVKQNGFTFLAPVQTGQSEALTALLDELGASVNAQTTLPFTRIDTLHFARFAVVAHNDQGKVRHSLLFTSNFDGPFQTHLKEWITKAQPGLHQILGFCEGYSARLSTASEDIERFLDTYSLPNQTFYVGAVGLGSARIRREAEVWKAIEDYVDVRASDPSWSAQDAEALRTDIGQHVRDSLPTDLPILPSGDVNRAVMAVLLLTTIPIVAAVIGAFYKHSLRNAISLFLAALVAEAVILGFGVLILRAKEQNDEVPDTRGDIERIQSLRAREDQIVQNQMTVLTPVKSGLLRQVLLRSVLFVVNFLARHKYNKGTLAGIPSIHFARWFLFDHGRQMVFESNFDGSWENYLGDFIDKAATGLTGIWSNTAGFPRTRFLVLDGAEDEQSFKAEVRNHQIVTNIWFSAYPSLTKENIRNNHLICGGLIDPASEPASTWLRRL